MRRILRRIVFIIKHIMKEFKICSKCKVPKPLDEFHKRNGGKYDRDHYCKFCANAKHRIKYNTDLEYKERSKRRNLKQLYSLSNDELNALHSISNCQICNSKLIEKRKMYIDHNHKTGKIRGLLCPKCNNLLGNCNDNIEILKLAMSYLELNN